MTALWIFAGIGYVAAIGAMMRSMAALPLPDRTEFDRAVHFRDLPEFAIPAGSNPSGKSHDIKRAEGNRNDGSVTDPVPQRRPGRDPLTV